MVALAVVPAYNEAGVLAAKALARSADGTLLRQRVNRGQSSAQTGISFALSAATSIRLRDLTVAMNTPLEPPGTSPES